MPAADTIKEIQVSVKRCAECGARFGVDAAFCPFCGVPLTASTWDPTRDALVGKIIDDRYEVLEPLGEGGMGTVYKVRHVTLNRHFAMKALRRDLAADAALSQRFIQEARATAAIKHPAVVAITDFGVLEDGIPYFVMELLVGETLSVRMRARGPMRPREVIDIARKIAEGLAASHAANVIHRDLKPENVFLVGPNELRIVDFGAAKIVGSSKLTRPGVVFGTPYYMSPEQAGGQPIDRRADVYSLGVLLFEMITGRVPFEADTYMGVLTKHMFAQPPRPSQAVAAGVQLGALEDLVLRALEKDPNARYASMEELKKALDDAEKKRTSDAPPATRTQPITPLGTMRMSTAERIERSVERELAREQKRKQKQLSTVVVAMVLTTVVGTGIVAIAVQKRRSSGSSELPQALAPSAAASLPPAPPAPPPPSSSPAESATVVVAPPPAPTPVFVKNTALPRVPASKTTPATRLGDPPATPATGSTTTAVPKKADDFSDPWQK